MTCSVSRSFWCKNGTSDIFSNISSYSCQVYIITIIRLKIKTKTKQKDFQKSFKLKKKEKNIIMEGTVTSSSNFYNATPSLDSGGDANAALAELDQNLRCGRLGDQAEAIVRFPSLFTKYPFPILINSALLKLADVFRQGSNFIRLCVLR